MSSYLHVYLPDLDFYVILGKFGFHMVTLVVIRVKVMLSQFPLWLRFEFISFTNLKFRNVFFIFVSSVHNQRSIEDSADYILYTP